MNPVCSPRCIHFSTPTFFLFLLLSSSLSLSPFLPLFLCFYRQILKRMLTWRVRQVRPASALLSTSSAGWRWVHVNRATGSLGFWGGLSLRSILSNGKDSIPSQNIISQDGAEAKAHCGDRVESLEQDIFLGGPVSLPATRPWTQRSC